MSDFVCPDPTCATALPPVEITAARTWTTRRYFCPGCGRTYPAYNTLGRVRDVSAIAIMALGLYSVFGGDADIDFDINSPT